MSDRVRCPKCNGEKFSIVNADTVRCAYCGTVFKLPQKEKIQQQTEQHHQQIVVNITGQQQQVPLSNKRKEVHTGRSCLKAIGVFFIVLLIFVLLSLISLL